MANPRSLIPLLLFVLAASTPISSSEADGTCSSGPNGPTITNFNYEAYLERYGYLDLASERGPFSPHDKLLEVAIQTFQSNFGLAEVGLLNDETMLKMLVPRCGVSDYANGKTGSGFLWPYFRLSYSYLSNFPEQGKPHVERALGAWATVSPFSFYDFYDFQTVALHEIGHILGLGHAKDEGAVMFPSITIH